MSPIQQMLLGAGGAVATKTYVDDIFSTFLYTGTGSARSINNGIDLSGEGGMTWVKERNNTDYHYLTDTVRGFRTTDLAGNTISPRGYSIFSNHTSGQDFYNGVTAFNSNGFSLGTDTSFNANGDDYTSWSFRKAPGFFDVVTYTGNGTAGRTVSHSLGSAPGMIIIKRTDTSSNWAVYHRGTDETNPANYRLRLNTSNQRLPGHFNSTEPTATVFTLATDSEVNANGGTYVAYVFAGGESTAATARSVDFDGTGDYLSIPDHSDLDFGTDDFTVECWFKKRGNYTSYESVIGKYQASGDKGFWIGVHSNGKCTAGDNGNNFVTSQTTIQKGQWYHVALVRNGTTVSLYLNGTLEGTHSTAPRDISNSSDLWIGNLQNYSTRDFEGHISNVRLVKGTAVYTSSFRPSTEPLTNITNTKLLCCNNSSTTGSTVTPGTITANGNPTASTDIPFDDPAGFVFGENEDQNVIKCGSYVGNGSSDGQSVYLGFEPQFIIQKNVSTDTGGTWNMYDSMRGVVTGGNDRYFRANTNQTAGDADLIEFTPTGFNIIGSGGNNNGDGRTFIYIAIRRPDGYVGKPPSLGTGVFAMDTGAGSSTIPNFDSNFIVDYALTKRFASSDDWHSSARLTGNKVLYPNLTNAEGTLGQFTWDSNVGWNAGTAFSSIYQSWMWKRHAGFDVVTYKGSVNDVPHNLGRVPEMIWAKNRDQSVNWNVYHKDLNGGSSPEDWRLKLNATSAESNTAYPWNDTAPTATHFTVGGWYNTNINGLFMLFASVDGISKVGYYTGNGTSQEIVTGFAPRFVIIKKTSGSAYWIVLDTLRGWGSGDDKWLQLNDSAAQGDYNWGYPGSTSFVVSTGDSQSNANNEKYIYYAHA